jgi:4-hydroxybenzoate polyprenyltransferase
MQNSSISFNIYPYIQLARLDKPWGIVLLAWPTLSALIITSKSFDIALWIVFILGIILTRSAGCVINDYVDMWLDGSVARTSHRPLVSGLISPHHALIFLGILLSLSASLLYFLPTAARICAVISAILIVIYPYTKRYFRAPQLFLGIVFSQGILMAYFSNGYPIDLKLIVFYIATVFWVIIYDTIYALTDYHDDLKMGSRSLATTLGPRAIPFIQYGYILLSTVWVLWGVHAQMTIYYYIMLLLCMYNYSQQSSLINKHKYFQAFLLNQSAGIYIFIGILVSSLIQSTVI